MKLTSDNVRVGLTIEHIQNPQWGQWKILNEDKFITGGWNIRGEGGRGIRLVMVGDDNWIIK